MGGTLEDMTSEIDRICVEELGDTIKYTPLGGAQLTIRAHVHYEDTIDDVGAGHGVEQDIEVHIIKSDVPTAPNSADRIILPRWPNKIFRPSSPRTDESGTHWVVSLKEVSI